MTDKKKSMTRRDFIKGTGCAAVGLAVGLPAFAENKTAKKNQTRVILIRHKDAVDAKGNLNHEVIGRMMDQAMMQLFDKKNPTDCWKQIIKPDDIVGIKTNVWNYLPTTTPVEQAIKRGVMSVGVAEKNIGIDDCGVLGHPIFKKTTALINARPMRTHAWSGVGSLIKNYIMFSPNPPDYHGNSCASLGALWDLPLVKGKTRLNVLVMLTPLFYGIGPHHFDSTYIWRYNGLLVGTDPVAVDSVGLRILQAKRKSYFGADKPIRPTAHHIALADSRYHLGTANPDNIELVKSGWQEEILI